MVAIAALLGIYILIYSGFILALSAGFRRVKKFELQHLEPKTTFSIVVPFRTEEKNLSRLLNSLSKLQYPKDLFELIFINDASEDFSETAINRWRLENGAFATTMIDNIRISGSPKKDAISRAMPIVKGEWVITTDADCELPANWLRAFNDFIIEKRPEMIAAPVVFGGKPTFLEHFQRLDFLSLQGVTIGSFGLGKAFMCNGANFGYTKKLFGEIGGFSGIDKFGSGDDVLLLQKAIKAFPQKVAYLKSADAIVKTLPAKSWAELFNQRVRWASKAVAYEQEFAQNLALATFFANLALVVSVMCTAADFFDWKLPLLLFAAKLVPDWMLIAKASSFLNRKKAAFPIFAAMVYPFFVVAVAVWAMFGRYSWKGRSFRR